MAPGPLHLNLASRPTPRNLDQRLDLVGDRLRAIETALPGLVPTLPPNLGARLAAAEVALIANSSSIATLSANVTNVDSKLTSFLTPGTRIQNSFLTSVIDPRIQAAVPAIRAQTIQDIIVDMNTAGTPLRTAIDGRADSRFGALAPALQSGILSLTAQLLTQTGTALFAAWQANLSTFGTALVVNTVRTQFQNPSFPLNVLVRDLITQDLLNQLSNPTAINFGGAILTKISAAASAAVTQATATVSAAITAALVPLTTKFANIKSDLGAVQANWEDLRKEFDVSLPRLSKFRDDVFVAFGSGIIRDLVFIAIWVAASAPGPPAVTSTMVTNMQAALARLTSATPSTALRDSVANWMDEQRVLDGRLRDRAVKFRDRFMALRARI